MKYRNVDLHCHSRASDGLLTPTQLVQRACGNGVDLLALTDHDTTGGLDELHAAAAQEGLRCLNGVEISVSWGDDQTVHVVGLAFDRLDQQLQTGLQRVRSGRDGRAHRIAAELERHGVADAFAGALRHAGDAALLSRSHFARYLVERGVAADVKSVFEHWLAKGKPGYVEHPWAQLSEAVQWIRDAGGVAVLAHPLRYRLTAAQRKKLYGEFAALGGEAVEVVSGNCAASEIDEMATVARRHGFLASRASDFHGPYESVDIGRPPSLPGGLTTLWSRWEKD